MAMSDLGGSMTAEQTIRSAVAAFVQNYNAGNIERLTEIFADDLIDMSAGGPTLGARKRSVTSWSGSPARMKNFIRTW